MKEYSKIIHREDIIRLPSKGHFDLTYRCNNDCRHCWLRLPIDSQEREEELNIDEIKRIVDEARRMGTRKWLISGGEPMLRQDFTEIFDYITHKSVSYSLNSNAALITPKIARLLRRKGSKMLVLYGATAKVHDHITRNPGSFEAAMQGFVYLKEAGAGFMVQLVPLKDNYHQFQDMITLAKSLSPHWRVGVTWLHLSASGNPKKNSEIKEQRLPPKIVAGLDKPGVFSESNVSDREHNCEQSKKNDHLFASCTTRRHEFYIDPYGFMTFCAFIKDPALHYNLREGSFKECWEGFIPSLSNKIKGEEEYLKNCGTCELRSECQWCPAHSYLEHRRYSAKVNYLCDLAKENKGFKDKWLKDHRRYFKIAGITLQVDSDIPITDTTFHPKFKPFEVDEPAEDMVSIKHLFGSPHLDIQELGKEIYRRPPWAIYEKGDFWTYVGISSSHDTTNPERIATINRDHTRALIINPDEETFRKGNLHSLTLFPTDQLLLARVLANREGCYFHSSGVIFEEKGLLFLGHSSAGKSTIVKILKDKAKILCDDRIIVRRHPEGFRIHGTWSHGEVSDVSADSAPLRAIFFLEKDIVNRIIPLDTHQEVLKKLLACLIKPFGTAEWWDKTLFLIGRIASEIPCYSLHSDKSVKIVKILQDLFDSSDKEK